MSDTNINHCIVFPPEPEPHSIEIELTNHCNAKCVFCPHGTMQRPKGFMALEQFERFVEDVSVNRSDLWLNKTAVSARFPTIVFAGLGEPLLHPRASDAVAMCAARALDSQLITNGIRLNAGRAEELIASGLNSVAVSLHTLDEAIYERVLSVSLNRFLPALRAALKVMADAGLDIQIWRVLPPPNLPRPNDADEFERLLELLPRAKVLGPSEPWQRDGAVPNSLHGPVNDYPKAGIRCALQYFGFGVSYDGQSVMCCVDFHRRTVPLGNVFEDGFLLALRRRRELIKIERTPEICSSCRKWKDRQYDEIFAREIQPQLAKDHHPKGDNK